MQGVMNHLNGMPDVPISSFWLLMLGAGLLLIAGVMLLLRKTGRVALERSLLTDEVAIYLSRIADAVERQARVPTVEEVVEMAQKRRRRLRSRTRLRIRCLEGNMRIAGRGKEKLN